jgi:hypothetical protein
MSISKKVREGLRRVNVEVDALQWGDRAALVARTRHRNRIPRLVHLDARCETRALEIPLAVGSNFKGRSSRRKGG